MLCLSRLTYAVVKVLLNPLPFRSELSISSTKSTQPCQSNELRLNTTGYPVESFSEQRLVTNQEALPGFGVQIC